MGAQEHNIDIKGVNTVVDYSCDCSDEPPIATSAIAVTGQLQLYCICSSAVKWHGNPTPTDINYLPLLKPNNFLSPKLTSSGQ